MSRTHQCLARITADFAELVIGVDNQAFCIGDADNAMLIKRQLLIGQIVKSSLKFALSLFSLAHQI